jgi:hypothetical protein
MLKDKIKKIKLKKHHWTIIDEERKSDIFLLIIN